QSMLSINERSHTTNTLRLSHDMQSQSRLTPRLRPIHLNDPTPRHTTNPKRQINRQRPRTDHTRPHELRRPRPQTHDRALTELPLDLRDSRVYGPRPFLVVPGVRSAILVHGLPPPLGHRLATSKLPKIIRVVQPAAQCAAD